jgi:hypothetical protein
MRTPGAAPFDANPLAAPAMRLATQVSPLEQSRSP